MTSLNKKVLRQIRDQLSIKNSRPIGALLFTDTTYPNNAVDHKVSLTASTIGITVTGEVPFTVNYIGKSTHEVATELNNSKFPVKVQAISDIGRLKEAELIVNGTTIPTSFDLNDRSEDGKSCIVRAKRWSASFNKLSFLLLKSPYDGSSSESWWPRISVGKFVHHHNGVAYTFDIPEYKNQVWSPIFGAPFVDVEGESVNFIDKDVISLNRAPIIGKPSNIVLESADGNTTYSSSVIKYIDSINGLIYLEENSLIPDDALVYYTYLERHLLYKKININAHFNQNPFLLNRYVLIYALPTKSSHGFLRDRGIYHTVGDSVVSAINSIEGVGTTEPITILGAYHIKSFTDSSSINITDTRSYGGGLKEDRLGSVAQKRFKESQYFADIGREEGIPYPGNGAIVLELPEELLETSTLEEIKRNAKKFVAAGVYPILNFKEDLGTETELTSNISLLDLSLNHVTGDEGSVENWINHSLTLPEEGLHNPYNLYTESSLAPTAKLNTTKDTVQLPPGHSYFKTYIKGGADATFKWEERGIDTEWTTKYWRDTRTVPSGEIIAGKVSIDAELGYKEIRNFTGISPFLNQGEGTIVESFAREAAEIVENIYGLSTTGSYGWITGSITNVILAKKESVNTVYPGVSEEYASLLKNFNVINRSDLFNDSTLLDRTSEMFHESILSGWPQTFVSGSFSGISSEEYFALKDIYAYAEYGKHKINAYTQTGNSSIVNTDIGAKNSISGAWKVASSIEDIWTGTGLYVPETRVPSYNLVSGTYIPTLTGTHPNLATNEVYLNTEYIKAYASLYATQNAPTLFDYTGYTSSGDAIQFHFSPGYIAMSGISVATKAFENEYRQPSLIVTGIVDVGNLYALPETYLTSHGRASKYAGHHLKNLTDAYDNLYYGNKEWAGYTEYKSKTAPKSSSGPEFLKDVRSKNIVWNNGQNLSWSETYVAAIGSIVENLNEVGDDLVKIATMGGIIEPGIVDAIRSYLWLPRHTQLGNPLFTSYSGTAENHLAIFNKGMAAALKGNLSEDGILSEGGTFRQSPAPFSGQAPSSLIKACAEAASYYKTAEDTIEFNKWLNIGYACLNNTVRLYKKDGGYPYSNIFSTISAPGDAGSSVLDGYLSMVDLKDTEFTSDELNAITGDITSIY